MAIRPAAEADRDFILAELALLPRPPYREPVGLLLSDPAENIWLDDERGLLCRISASQSAIRVVWLLPRAAWTVDNAPALHRLLVATLRASYDTLPVAERNRVISASFQDLPDGGRQLCEFWRDVFFTDPDDPVRTRALVQDTGTIEKPRWEIAMTMELATELGEKVRDSTGLITERARAFGR